jgi:LCP family protein required for cell wall assembly
MKKLLRRTLAAALAIILLTGAAPKAEAADRINILLIGLDRRPGLAGCRSDTVILCSCDPVSGKLDLVSFLRDLYLPVPDHGSDRLNAAYAYGGRELLKQTLAGNFGVTVDGCVEVDFGQFSRIVDALGGVRLRLREDEAATIRSQVPWSTVTGGEQLLTGEEALCYSRIRELDPDGDQSRTRRQRSLLLGIIDTWKDADLGEMVKAMREVMPMVSTDLRPLEIMDWIFTAAPKRAALVTRSLQIPAPGTVWDETVRGMAVLVCDMDANRRLLQDQLNGD